MPPYRDTEYIVELVSELRTNAGETEWLEFKERQQNPETIGKSISALSNGAVLSDKKSAYMVWGIEDSTHAVVGTNFSPSAAKKGNEPLETWLGSLLRPRIDFRIYEVTVSGKPVALMEIEPASQQPVAFGGDEFIRVGSSTRRLKDFPNKEAALWRAFDQSAFEDGIASERVSDDDVLLSLNHPAYFDLLKIPLPDGRARILDALRRGHIISPCDAGGWNITKLGAILFARNLDDFSRLGRKAVRIIQYRGTSRLETLREREVERGYAVGFEEVIGYIMALTPADEVIERSLRRELPMFPEIAVRELVANMLIHQDFSVTGAGPMVEIFDGRIEITNPGSPLVETDRFWTPRQNHEMNLWRR